jgi:hypothetical protein
MSILGGEVPWRTVGVLFIALIGNGHIRWGSSL